jgi:drug/metabolite transporter (DMT)-like permease
MSESTAESIAAPERPRAPPTRLLASPGVFDRRRAAGVALVVLSSVTYGAGPTLAKGGVYSLGVDWLTLIAWRFLIGAAVAWVWVLAVSGNRAALRSMSRRTIATSLALGALYVGNAATYYAALETVDASLAALLLYVYPVVVALVSTRVGAGLAGIRPWVALVLAIGGAVLALGGIPTGRVPPVTGLALAVVSPVIYAGYIVLTARFAGERRGQLPTGGEASPARPADDGRAAPPVAPGPDDRSATAAAPVAALMLTGTAAVVVALAIVVGHPIAPSSISGDAWPALLAIGAVCTALPVQAFYAGTARIGAAQAALVSTVEPISTVSIAALVLGERLAPLQLVGGALVIGSVVLAQTTPGTATPAFREE